MNTREKIMYEAMCLFSKNGFDSTTVRDIARNVGIVNSALYKHFKSKDDILDAIIIESKKRFMSECNSLDFNIDSEDDVKKICFTMFNFQTKDEWNVMFRRLLEIEKLKNPELQNVYKEFFIDQRINYQAELFKKLMEKGYMIEADPYALAIEIYAPFYMYNLFPSEEINKHLEKHIEYFFNNNIRRD